MVTEMRKNGKGLYDLKIRDEAGELIVDVKNITFHRAVNIMEENMYGRVHYDGEG